MNTSTRRMVSAAVIVAAIGAVFSLYTYMQEDFSPSPPESAQQVPAPPEPIAPTPPPPHYPIEALVQGEASGEPVPRPAEDVDAVMRKALAGVFGASLDKYFNLSGIVRRIVVTIDNLPREKVARALMPVKPVPGTPVTAGSGDALTLDPANAARYETYVQIAEMVPTALLVEVYVRHYPLFQQQYAELGYPGAYFNNRLVEVIDHLLVTPVVPSSIRLLQPKVLYTFADPELEKLSEGQKIMLRMGENNAARIRVKLRDIRAAVTRGQRGMAPLPPAGVQPDALR